MDDWYQLPLWPYGPMALWPYDYGNHLLTWLFSFHGCATCWDPRVDSRSSRSSRSRLQRPERHSRPWKRRKCWDFALEVLPKSWRKKRNIIDLPTNEKWWKNIQNLAKPMELRVHAVAIWESSVRHSVSKQPLRVWICLNHFRCSQAIRRSLCCSHRGIAVCVGVKHQAIFLICLHSFVQVPKTHSDLEKLRRARLRGRYFWMLFVFVWCHT